MLSSNVGDLSLRAPPKTPAAGNYPATSKRSLWVDPPMYQNSLSKRQMESLVAFCDTLLPSVDPPSDEDSGEDGGATAEFYRTSASMAGVPERIGSIMCGMMHPQMAMLRLALLMLSTWYGTLLICGRRSMTWRFPFVRRFAKLEQDKRESIVYSWSSSSFRHLRMLYICLKCITMRIYFTQVNEKKQNPSWAAIDYCGPDPTQTQPAQTHPEPPLHSALLHLTASPELIAAKLRQHNFPTPTFAPSNPPALHCDAVIVGSGSGGSVAAGVLSAAGHKILLIEKGEFYSPSELSLLEGPTLSAMYEGGGIVATDDVSILIQAGSTVGGGSTVNWSAAIPTPENVRREWSRDLRLELFGSEAYDRALEAVCGRMGVQSGVKEEGFNSAVLRRGCEAVGYDVADVTCNAGPDHYCGWCQFGCKEGKKRGALVTWLDDMARSGNGLVLPGCRAVEVLKVAGGKRPVADGVLVESSDGVQFVIKAKVTIVGCGALNTPRLLKRSGLKNKHIGKNLHLHPVAMAWGYFPKSSKFPPASKRSYQGGILTAMSRPNNKNIILQTPSLHPGVFGSLTPWVSSSDFRLRMRRFSRTAHVFALVRDRGSGEVDYPGRIGYRVGREDEEGLREGVEMGVRVLEGAGAEEVGRVGMRPLCSAHQMGSCRMRVREEDGAVAGDGELWELQGLYVVDSSVFPTAIGVNPMVTVMAVAFCVAKGVEEVLTRKKKKDY